MKTSSFNQYSGVGRISIACYAPSWAKRGFKIYPKLNPKREWLKIYDKALYTKLYTEEILSKLDAQTVWDELHVLAHPYEPILLCWERPPFNDRNFCHRRIIAEWFEKELGKKVPEYERYVQPSLF